MFDGILDIEESPWKHVNDYLHAGYRLLTIQNVARASVKPDGGYYIRRFPVYVVGRPQGVAPFTPAVAA